MNQTPPFRQPFICDVTHRNGRRSDVCGSGSRGIIYIHIKINLALTDTPWVPMECLHIAGALVDPVEVC